MKPEIGFFIRSNNGTIVETYKNGDLIESSSVPVLSKREERQVYKIIRKYLKLVR